MEVFNELIKYEPNFLDRPLKELVPLRFLGEVAVDAYRALIKRIDNIPMAQEEREAKLADGQDAGKALLTIEEKIGSLYNDIPSTENASHADRASQKGKIETIEEYGISRRDAQRAQEIFDNPKEVQEVIKEAEENQDIPTKTAVLNKIKYKKEVERVKGTREKTQMELRGEELSYNMKLQEVINILPPKPPSNMTDKGYLINKKYALIIINRLEVFKDGEEESDIGGSIGSITES